MEPRGFEPLTSAVQRRQDRLPEVSGVCKIPANGSFLQELFALVFRRFTRVDAQMLRLLHQHKVWDDQHLTCCLEAKYASFVQGIFSSFDDHPEVWGVAPLFALLLHWVQPLPTGAVGMEYKRCASYTSNTQSALSKWHGLV